MIGRFVILDHGSKRPDAERIIFCDGAGGRIFREGADLELSHWRPNRTPAQYRAGTSTEICFRFLDAPIRSDWTVAVNNHLDVDGILSVYVLVHSEAALTQRESIIQAAEMGDFWGWGEQPAQQLFQGLTRLMNGRSQANVRVQDIYAEAFARIPALIAESDPESPAIHASLHPLRRGLALVESGVIKRKQWNNHVAQYVIPESCIAGDDDWSSYIPGFNEVISPKGLLWPHVRAKWDRERVCLVSAGCTQGWKHELWFPGYLWADTERLWTVPGMRYRDGMESYDLNNPELRAAVAELQSMETADGVWTIADGVSPFHRKLQSCFPVVLRVLNREGQPTCSGLTPERVGNLLSDVFR